VRIAGVDVPLHPLLILEALTNQRGEPVWHLAREAQFDSVWSPRARPILDRLGFVRFTPGNARVLLSQDQAVLVFAEEKPSTPPYEMQRFDDLAMDLIANAGCPVVLAVFVGTHESHMVVEHDEHQSVLNERKLMETQYVMRFLPAVSGLQAGDIRRVLQANIDELTEKHPRTGLFRYLDGQHRSEAYAIAG